MPSVAEAALQADARKAALQAGTRGLVKPSKPPAPETHRERAQRFYQSGAWRKLRYEILRRDGARCVVCGRGAKDGIRLEIDHIEPISKNFTRRLDPDNCQVMCGGPDGCNQGKSNTDSIDWRPPRPALVVDNVAA
jgi:5-methylcytosine-specific restriction endonuclease McrA